MESYLFEIRNLLFEYDKCLGENQINFAIEIDHVLIKSGKFY